MTLKEATTNSLLMFVAATCVVLIAKAVTPAPQMTTVMAGSGSESSTSIAKTGTPTLAMQNGIKVYYMHGNTRCPTCRTIEAYAKEAVESGFGQELQSGQIEWQVINYESPGNEHYALDYQVVAPIVVLAKYEGGKQLAWKGLPEVWEHVSDKSAFVGFVQTELRNFMAGSQSRSSVTSSSEPSTSKSAPLSLPVPE